jgi:hypothetical protein
MRCKTADLTSESFITMSACALRFCALRVMVFLGNKGCDTVFDFVGANKFTFRNEASVLVCSICKNFPCDVSEVCDCLLFALVLGG